MEILKFIKETMASLDIPYEFGEWSSSVTYPYFVGEMTEIEPTTEDGLTEYSFLLTGFNRGKIIDLETKKENIKQHFHPIYGYRKKITNGSIAAFYGGAMYVPTGEAELKRIQITLKIKLWKGNI